VNSHPAAARLARAVEEATGEPFGNPSTEPVGGGCIHTALALSGAARGADRYFAKVNEAASAPMFAAEADGLAALGAAGALTVPKVVAQGADGEFAWLVLEWLELGALDGASAAALGAGLAAQHRAPQARFGWGIDNFIGASAQANGWSDDWTAFWRDRRLHAQLRLAAANRLPSRMIDRGERLAADCGAFFSTYLPQPSLLHGDLWGGNVAALATAKPLAKATPVIFDPATYVGDREADVAMTELFGGFARDFQAAYRAAWPLDDGYKVRRDFYNLYHVLNHANLFAGGYVRQSEQAIERLLAEIK
jgi:fructosamine-3-kinase